MHGKLPNWHEHQRLNLVQASVDFLDQGDTIRGSLSRSVLRLSDDVDIVKDLRDCLLLDGGWQLEAHFKDALKQ